MIDLPIFFVSGLPRSGSTLLMNILGQNPSHHVTPTSGLIEIFMSIKSGWKKYIEFKAEGLEKAKPRIASAMKGLLYGYFEKEIDAKKVIFDKSRGWLNYIEDLENVLGKKVKIIVPVRDVRAICASFEKIYRNRGIEFDYPLGDNFYQCQTIEGRCEVLLSKGGVIGIAINRIRDCFTRKVQDRLVVVPYKALVTDRQVAMDVIYNFLGLPQFQHDFNDIKQITYENDVYHGMDLHTIKPKVDVQGPNWYNILPEKYADDLAKRYDDINSIAGYC